MLKFDFWQRIALEVQNTPRKQLEAQMLVSNKLPTPLKVLQLIQYVIQLRKQCFYIAHTIVNDQMQIRREGSLFIRAISNWAFSTSLTERHKQALRYPVACTTVADKSEVKFGTNGEQY